LLLEYVSFWIFWMLQVSLWIENLRHFTPFPCTTHQQITQLTPDSNFKHLHPDAFTQLLHPGASVWMAGLLTSDEMNRDWEQWKLGGWVFVVCGSIRFILYEKRKNQKRKTKENNEINITESSRQEVSECLWFLEGWGKIPSTTSASGKLEQHVKTEWNVHNMYEAHKLKEKELHD
jgi:hypothetical protein